jgi:POT family proton-dependent oligopeptide transporter
MWERFTYYGMRALLVLFMTAAVVNGGLGIDDRTANAIYGMYISGTYLLCLLGGWIADRLIGQQRSVFFGGILIMIGNASLAVGDPRLFFVGLVVIVCGVGLLKPNISAIVAQLYPEGGSRRDAGFSIFYMGINLGAFFGSLFVPIVAAKFGWNIGFALPAIGMLLGLFQFRYTRKYLGDAGVAPPGKRGTWWPVVIFVAIIALLAALVFTGKMKFDPVQVSRGANWAMVALAAGYFAYLLWFAGLDRTEHNRVWAMLALFVGCAMFWAGYEQAGASFNLFAERHTDRHVFGMDLPAGVLQAVNPLFIIIFAPVFAGLWVNLGRRNMDLSSPAKFGVGLIFGASASQMFAAADHVVHGQKVLPTWLILTYLLHLRRAVPEPVGLSSMPNSRQHDSWARSWASGS